MSSMSGYEDTIRIYYEGVREAVLSDGLHKKHDLLLWVVFVVFLIHKEVVWVAVYRFELDTDVFVLLLIVHN